MNFQIYGHGTVLTSIKFITKIWDNESTRQKRRMWIIWGCIWLMCKLEWNSVIDDGIDHGHSRLHACIRATGGHFEYSPWHELAKTLLTARKFIVKRHLFQILVVSWQLHFTR